MCASKCRTNGGGVGGVSRRPSASPSSFLRRLFHKPRVPAADEVEPETSSTSAVNPLASAAAAEAAAAATAAPLQSSRCALTGLRFAHTHIPLYLSHASSSLTYKICEGRQRTGSALGFFALRVRFGFGFGLANADDEQQRAKKNGGKSRKGKRRSFRGLLAGAASVSASLENRGDQRRRRSRSRSARDGIGRNERCAVCCVRAGSETSAGATSASASASCDDGDGEHWSDSLIEVRQRNADLRGTWERLHTEFRRHRAFLEHLRADYEQSKDLGAAPRNSTNRSHYSTVLYTCTV